MASLLQLQGATKFFGTKCLFSNASFSVNNGEHIGVIGPNGAGKSTLFKVLVGQEALDSGTVVRSQGLRLGYLQQHDDATPALTVEEYVLEGASVPVWDLKQLGRGLGMSNEFFGTPLQKLSGGYRMRAKLLRLLGQEPDLLLLDEPTNYLDLETLLILEEFLQGFRSAFLLISHDREFLRRVTDYTVEVEAGDIQKFPGNIDDYFEQKELLREQLAQRVMSQEAHRKEVLDFAARFGAKATKARQVQSRLRQLEKVERIEVKALPVTAKIKIPPPERTGKLTVRIVEGELGYAEKTVVRGANLEILQGDHVGVVGLNGAGKSTLLKALAGALNLRSGKIEFGYGVTLGYYAQHVGDALDPKATVLEAMGAVAHKSALPQDILDIAGSLLFSGESVRKIVGKLSGGEKARVALGQILLKRAPFLLLDEPTNHLDFYTVEALTQALGAFPGTLVVVSHDQSFIKRTSTKILEVRDGQVNLFPGTYEDYVWSLQKGALAERAAVGKGEREKVNAPKQQSAVTSVNDSNTFAQQKERRRNIENRLKQIERQLPKLDTSVNALRQKVESLNAALEVDGANIEKTQELAKVHGELEAGETQWLELAAEQESLRDELSQFKTQ